MAIPINPYIAGNPVGNTNAFVGREDIRREVVRVLHHPDQNAITLYGQRRIGKTSVLQFLVTHLPQEGNFIPIFFDLEDKAALGMGQVLIELEPVLLQMSLTWRFQTLGKTPRDTDNYWLRYVLGSLPEGASLVLFFDEFDVIASPKSGSAAAAFFPYLRDLLAFDRARLQFVFVLGRSPADLSSIALSIFKGISSQRITLLSKENTEKLIRISEKNSSLSGAQMLLKQSGNSPMAIHF